jgi:hypothetical protein
MMRSLLAGGMSVAPFCLRKIPERRMKHRIEDIAAECVGVKDVDNRLRVAPFERAPADRI